MQSRNETRLAVIVLQKSRTVCKYVQNKKKGNMLTIRKLESFHRHLRTHRVGLLTWGDGVDS